jgi:hypothetical protein
MAKVNKQKTKMRVNKNYITQYIIQFNSIHVYLRPNLTARRPITKYARVCRNKQQKSYSKK